MTNISKELSNEDYYQFGYEIFKLIYLDEDLKDTTFYLLQNGYVKLEDLEVSDIKYLLEHTNWGFNYILYNLKSILCNSAMYEIIDIIVKYSKNKPEIYQRFLENIMSLNEQQIRDRFIISSISNHINLPEDVVIASLYQNSEDYYYHRETKQIAISKIPSILLDYAKSDERIKNMMINNFDLFLSAEERSKMKIVDYFYNLLPKEILEKYDAFYQLYKKRPNRYTDKSLSILMNHNLSKFLLEMLKEKEVSYLASGSTTQVFKIDNFVLKLSLNKYEINTEKDLFLMEPTETKILYDKDNNPILVIEIQKYLEKSYDGKEITKEDINNFLTTLDNFGYTITDPNCLDKKFDNFGFLEDYHDANLGEFTSHEELPEWFKKRPIVLYDIDLVYKKDYEKKKIFMDKRVI